MTDAETIPGLDVDALFPSEWGARVRRIPDILTREPGPLTYDLVPWVRDYLDDFAPEIVAIKGAQLGWTEASLTKALHAVVVDRASVLYCFPAADGASDFSASRFDPAIELSEVLSAAFTDVSNVGHKRSGSANLWIRGMRSRSGLKSIDPRQLYLDERDEMIPAMVALAEKRVSGQLRRQIVRFSTPTIPDWGIDADYAASDRKRWLVPCPRCHVTTALTWRVVDEEQRCVVCPSCNAPWTEEQRRAAVRAGAWIAEAPGAGRSGYAIQQVASLVLTIPDLCSARESARHDPSALTEWHNAIGEPYVAEGTSLTEPLVRACQRDYPAAQGGAGCTMGVDVGSRLHYRISERRDDRRDPRGIGRRVLAIGTLQDFEELDGLMSRFGVRCCVIDANPERRKAREFQDRHGGAAAGRVWLAFYPGDPRELVAWSDERGTVNVHRTEAMDATLARFRYPAQPSEGLPHGTVDLPGLIPHDVAPQLCAPVRVYESRPDGTRRAVYRENGADHYAHASLYDEIAALRDVEAVSAVTAPPAELQSRQERTGRRGLRMFR